LDLSLLAEGVLKIFNLPSIAIFLFTFLGAKKLKLDPIALTLIGGVLGAILL